MNAPSSPLRRFTLFSRMGAEQRRLLANFLYDWRRFARHSFVFGARRRKHRAAMLHILAHSLEHGMSLPAPRPGFGHEKAASLLTKVESYTSDFEVDASARAAMKALDAWVDFHRRAGLDMSGFAERLDRLEESSSFRASDVAGGVELTTAAEIAQATDFDYRRFVRARHSVRQYAARPVGPETIREAVRDAQQCPSVCNRQTCRVYALTDREAIAEVLRHQSGNAGFGQEVAVLFIIVADMQQLNLIGERYQGWIDGGIFAMSLALALHARGLGACCLNWSVAADTDRRMRSLVGIPDNELVITLMSAGYLKDDFAVPISQRKPVEDILLLDPPLHRA